jgi:hypothetical protein
MASTTATDTEEDDEKEAGGELLSDHIQLAKFPYACVFNCFII